MQQIWRRLVDRQLPLAFGCVLGRGLVAQRTMRSLRIVILLPERAQRHRLWSGLELLAVQKFLAELAVERLRVAILPGSSSTPSCSIFNGSKDLTHQEGGVALGAVSSPGLVGATC